MKKLIGLLLALAMLGSMIAVPALAESPVEINMFISMPEYADAVRALIDEYKTVAPNVVPPAQPIISRYAFNPEKMNGQVGPNCSMRVRKKQA